jgi:predicted transposase YbfD/YdcC
LELALPLTGGEISVATFGENTAAINRKVVTGDALHCNRRTVEAINARGGDWCLALKGNQESLLSDARGCFSGTIDPRQQAMTEERGHGRKEVRKATIVSAKSFGEYHEFPGLKAFGRIEATREVDGKVTSETRYFALSWMPTPDILLTTVRDHWSIENALHWQLDVSFREDAARNRKDNAPGNIAVLRRRALDVVRQDKLKSSGTKPSYAPFSQTSQRLNAKSDCPDQTGVQRSKSLPRRRSHSKRISGDT